MVVTAVPLFVSSGVWKPWWQTRATVSQRIFLYSALMHSYATAAPCAGSEHMESHLSTPVRSCEGSKAVRGPCQAVRNTDSSPPPGSCSTCDLRCVDFRAPGLGCQEGFFTGSSVGQYGLRRPRHLWLASTHPVIRATLQKSRKGAHECKANLAQHELFKVKQRLGNNDGTQGSKVLLVTRRPSLSLQSNTVGDVTALTEKDTEGLPRFNRSSTGMAQKWRR